MIKNLPIAILVVGCAIGLVLNPLSPLMDTFANNWGLSENQLVYLEFAGLQVFLLAFVIFIRLRRGEKLRGQLRRSPITVSISYAVLFVLLCSLLVLGMTLGHYRPVREGRYPMIFSFIFFLGYFLGAEMIVSCFPVWGGHAWRAVSRHLLLPTSKRRTHLK